MEKLYWVVPDDSRGATFILYEMTGPDRILSLKSAYADLKCNSCGKVDEFAAIRSNPDLERISIATRRDIICTADDFVCVSSRFVEMCNREKISGLEFFPIGRKQPFFLAIPSIVLRVSRELAQSVGMKLFDPCDKCGRFRETTFWPSASSICDNVPQASTIFTTDLRPESVRGTRAFLIVNESARLKFLDHQLKGIDQFLKL